ncbi:Alpha/beta fold family hydrolase [Mycena sanguinolenta]|uniref:Alpha/beta fold family hydrolase n=1 Tax=Mycena sanguinolenta TaxID=230812 RepID=A0A8H6YXJ2_9AGAR|nr:Alpha/beta fold family hydrolase [Mycena sanguinolenta]
MQSLHSIVTAPGTTLDVFTSIPTKKSSKPTLLFVHFWGGSRRTFSALASRLSADFPLILPTLRGWGGSIGPDDPAAYGTTNNADDLAALVAHLRADKALAGLFQHGIIIVGHSMGAKIAQLELPTEMREQQITAYSSRESAELALKYVLLGSDVGAEELCLLVDDCVDGNDHARMAWPAYGVQDDYEALLADRSVNIPVAVVVGGLDKVETAERVDEKVVRVLKEAGASVTVTVLEGVGHMMPVEAPMELEKIICNFVEQK